MKNESYMDGSLLLTCPMRGFADFQLYVEVTLSGRVSRNEPTTVEYFHHQFPLRHVGMEIIFTVLSLELKTKEISRICVDPQFVESETGESRASQSNSKRISKNKAAKKISDRIVSKLNHIIFSSGVQNLF